MAYQKIKDGLWLFGNNNWGQFGDGSLTVSYVPKKISGKEVKYFTSGAGGATAARILEDDTLWLSGYNNQGQLGDNTVAAKSSPVQTVAGGTWKSVSVASTGDFTSAIKTNGELWSWGINSHGYLGDNTIVKKSSPVQTVAGGTNWKQVACSYAGVAAIKTDGTLWNWGNATYGQLGDNTVAHKSSPIQTVAVGTNWKQVSCGDYHTAAIKTNGELWLWGYNNNGQLGISDRTNRSSPIQTVAGGTTWKQVSCGVGYTAAVKTDGTLWTWGGNANGFLGDNTITAKSSPVQTYAGGTTWKQVSCFTNNTFAIKTDGTLWTWSLFGHGSTLERPFPGEVHGGGTNWTIHSDYLDNCDKFFPIRVGANSGKDYDGLLEGDFARFGETTYPYQTVIDTNAPLHQNSAEISQESFHLQTAAYIQTDGTLWCVSASNTSGEIGNNVATNPSSPVQTIAGGTNWKQVSAFYNHVHAIKTDGTLWGWGYNFFGELGKSDRTNRSSPVQTVAGGTTWKQVSAGQNFVSAIKTNGELWSWGHNGNGQLGDNTTVAKSSPVQVFGGGTTWKQVACGFHFCCAVKTDGTLWRWGSNYSSAPAEITGTGTNWKQVAAGDYHAVAVKTNGQLWTWGSNPTGALGDGTFTDKLTSPVQTFLGGTDWKQVSARGEYTFAIKTDGTLWKWGASTITNEVDGTKKNASVPVQVKQGGTNWRFNRADDPLYAAECLPFRYGYGSDADVISVDNDPKFLSKSEIALRYPKFYDEVRLPGLWGWGGIGYGELGLNEIVSKSSPIQTIAGGTNWKQVACGYGATAAIKTDGTLWTWGLNANGQLGDNTIVSTSSPTQTVAGGTNWKQVSISRYSAPHGAAVKTDGTLWLWGRGVDGQLGDNAATTRSSPVQTIALGNTWKEVSCGETSTAAIKTDGTLWVWGYSFFGLGDGTTSQRNSPVQTVSGGTNWKQVSTSFFNFAAIKTDGTLWVWGNNAHGNLGDSSVANKSSPVQTVAGGTNWKQVSVGSNSMFAVKTDGTLWGWGLNTDGQLGNNGATKMSSPIQTVAGGTNWKLVASGRDSTVAIKTDGTLWNWGAGANGALGDNTTTPKSSPIQTVMGGTNWKSVAIGFGHTMAISYFDDDSSL